MAARRSSAVGSAPIFTSESEAKKVEAASSASRRPPSERSAKRAALPSAPAESAHSHTRRLRREPCEALKSTRGLLPPGGGGGGGGADEEEEEEEEVAAPAGPEGDADAPAPADDGGGTAEGGAEEGEEGADV
jgi:hypothetical protein